MSIKKIHHVGIVVKDMERVSSFLSQVLGFEAVDSFSYPWAEGKFYRLGDTQVEVVTYPDPQQLEARLHGESVLIEHLAVEVDEIDSTVAGLRQHGVTGPDEIFRSRIGATFRPDPASTADIVLQIFEPASDALK